MMLAATTFKALGDPVRLQIIERLSSGSLYTLGSVTQNLGLTRQGARKHIKVLSSAGLITIEPVGRTAQISLVPESLKVINSFTQQMERNWENSLQALKNYVESELS